MEKNQEISKTPITDAMKHIVPMDEKMYLFVFEQMQNNDLTEKATRHIETLGFEINSINKLNNTIRATLL